MTNDDVDGVLAGIKETVKGTVEVYRRHEFTGWRLNADGDEERFTLEVLDAGSANPEARYTVKVTTENGGRATTNPAESIRMALAMLHNYQLDRRLTP